ncbi:MAG: hypothetical protein LBS05_05935 [Tannerellaceae bacterium]|jgi:hypothetical protein|nr:hypothetical protein [Tannerellaceae bacterium]
MEVLALLLPLSLLAGAFLVAFIGKQSVRYVQAGNIDDVHAEDTPKQVDIFDTFTYKGTHVNRKDYDVRVVSGNCMWQRKIRSGDIVFIRKIEDDEGRRSIQPGDVLLVRSNFGDKLREFYAWIGEGKDRIDTFRYLDDGSIRHTNQDDSPGPLGRPLSDVIGKVEYCKHY